jgi:pyrroloquinoline quinone (PQQ) biosynthesis protein C
MNQPTSTSKQELRHSERHAVEIKCVWSTEHRSAISCENLSWGGMGILGETTLTPGASLDVRCHHRNSAPFHLLADVVYCRDTGDRRYATGLRFTALDVQQQTALRTLLEQFRQDMSAQQGTVLTLTAAATACPASVDLPVVPKSRPRGRRFTPHPAWVFEMDIALNPYREAIWASPLVQETSSGQLSLSQVHGWSTQFYPFVEAFPQFMATYLAKAPDAVSRAFLIDNLKVEKRHAEQWIDMAVGFGVPPADLLNPSILAEVEALSHWLWSITARGSFVEAVSATNYAIEGVTQGIAKLMVQGFGKYHGQDGVSLTKKAYSWMEAHARYDDLHPAEALEIMKQHAITPDLQYRVKQAARRSLEYLKLALDACYHKYAKQNLIST